MSCWKIEDLLEGTTYVSMRESQPNGMLKVLSKDAESISNSNGLNSINASVKFNNTTSIVSAIENTDYNRFSNKWTVDDDWRNKDKSVYYSVSAWVWSDTKVSAMLTLKSDTENLGVSFFHSGDKKWQYLTVIYPYGDNPEYFKIGLSNRYGTAYFRDITAVALRDNRFKEKTDLFSEHLFKDKTSRKRILFIGASNVHSYTSLDDGYFSTIPFLLQSKLESIYPGKYEVVNYGLVSYGLESDLVSYKTNDLLTGPLYRVFGNNVSFVCEPSISSLKADYIFISLTPWGPSFQQMRLNRDGQFKISCFNGCDSFNGKNNCNAVLDSLLKYINYPSVDNYKILQQTYSSAQQCSTVMDKIIKDVNGDLYNLNNIDNNNYFLDLYSGANSEFRYVVNKLVTLIGHSSKTFWFTMPTDLVMSRLSLNKSDYFSHLYGTKLSDDICRDLNDNKLLSCLDIDRFYQNEYSVLNLSDYSKIGIFFDLVHLTYRGNEFIADTLFSYFEGKL
ncbi:hypothetical protein [Candidatus Magnetominusculus dajiuhuensis]|uniref:hypothetical protein n=1 Tax=Candidatus Magnetominusculus dajiuhuensis TaxID=3137712 RepID=UPI003B4331AE